MINKKEVNIIWNLINDIVNLDTEIEYLNELKEKSGKRFLRTEKILKCFYDENIELENEIETYKIEIDGLIGIINGQKETIQHLEAEINFLLDETMLFDEDFLEGL